MTPDQLKEARQALGLSQTELAQELGWSSRRQITNLETGVRVISQQTALAVECLMWRAGLKNN